MSHQGINGFGCYAFAITTSISSLLQFRYIIVLKYLSFLNPRARHFTFWMILFIPSGMAFVNLYSKQFRISSQWARIIQQNVFICSNRECIIQLQSFFRRVTADSLSQCPNRLNLLIRNINLASN